MKLKFDRLINISLTYGTSVTIPKDEFWSFLYKASGSGEGFFVGEQSFSDTGFRALKISGEIKLHSKLNKVLINGVAFKVVKEE